MAGGEYDVVISSTSRYPSLDTDMLSRIEVFDQTTPFFYFFIGVGILYCSFSGNAFAQSSPSNEYIVVEQLNLWYFGTGCYGGFEDYDCEGNSVVSITPLQGFCWSLDYPPSPPWGSSSKAK